LKINDVTFKSIVKIVLVFFLNKSLLISAVCRRTSIKIETDAIRI